MAFTTISVSMVKKMKFKDFELFNIFTMFGFQVKVVVVAGIKTIFS